MRTLTFSGFSGGHQAISVRSWWSTRWWCTCSVLHHPLAAASFALRKCAEDSRDQSNVQAVDTVLHNFYVDDCLKSVNSEEDAVLLYHTLRAVCGKGGFRLTKWVSNSRSVLLAIPEEERATEVKDLDLDRDALPKERALGVHWCTQSDSLRFKIIILHKAPTRRNILSIVRSVYDWVSWHQSYSQQRESCKSSED